MTALADCLPGYNAAAECPPESEFLTRLRAGDQRAFEALVREHGGRLLSLARRFLPCEADCEDVVQETFVAAFRGLAAFHGKARLGTWLHRIAVNLCLTKLRARRRHPEVPLDDLLPSFNESGGHADPESRWADRAEDQLISAETRAQVRACIDRLPEAYRTVLLLRDLSEYDTDETAAILGLAPGAVKTRLHRARQALRTLLEPLFAKA